MVVCMMPAVAKADDSTNGINYLALGDSISTGYGLANQESEAFPALVAKEYNFNLDNQAVDGLTSDGLNSLIENGELDDNIKKADVITITIGGNDLLDYLCEYLAEQYNAQNPGSTYTAEFVKGLLAIGNSDMIEFAKNNIISFIFKGGFNEVIGNVAENIESIVPSISGVNENAIIIVATQYNPYKVFQNDPSYGTVAQLFNSAVETLNDNFRKLTDCEVADVYKAFDNSKENLCNASINPLGLDIHPNAAGHATIAEVMSGVINNKIDIVQANSDVRNAAESISKNLSGIQLNQADANTVEAVEKAVQTAVSKYVTSSVSTIIDVISDEFVPAVAGTADQKAGVDGRFNAKVQLTADTGNGPTREVQVSGVIKATAYTTPAKDPSQEDNGKDDGKQTVTNNTTDKDSIKTADKTGAKTDVPKTGDTTNVMPYLVLMLIAGTVTVIAVRRKFAKR